MGPRPGGRSDRSHAARDEQRGAQEAASSLGNLGRIRGCEISDGMDLLEFEHAAALLLPKGAVQRLYFEHAAWFAWKGLTRPLSVPATQALSAFLLHQSTRRQYEAGGMGRLTSTSSPPGDREARSPGSETVPAQVRVSQIPFGMVQV
jgi:hypothetical protein